MTPPQGHPEQPPSGPVDPNHPTQAFASPGQIPPGQPSQGFPAEGPPPQGQPTRSRPQQGPPQQGPPPPPPGRPFQGPPPQGPPPQGPPPQGTVGGGGWGQPSGFGSAHPSAPGQFGTPNRVGAPRPKSANAIWTLGLVSLVAVVCGLSIGEDGRNEWETVHAWGALAILGSLLTLATVVAAGTLGAARAWQVAACGAGALVLFWVLFVLPSVGSNTSLVTTIGVATGAVAVWIAPGREDTTRPGEDGTSGHTW